MDIQCRRGDSVDRRAFIGALTAGAFATASRAAAAQQAGGVRHVGILTAGVLPRPMPPALVDELRERGWVEGQNLVIDRRGGDGHSGARTGARCGTCADEGRCHRELRCRRGRRVEECDHDHPHRRHDRRPGPSRPGFEFVASRRQYHRPVARSLPSLRPSAWN